MRPKRARASANTHPVIVDASPPGVADALGDLDPDDLDALERTLRQLATMAWEQVLRSKGLRWEKVPVPNPVGGTSYSMRITRRMRAIAYRDGDYLRIVSLHPDHDSAYER